MRSSEKYYVMIANMGAAAFGRRPPPFLGPSFEYVLYYCCILGVPFVFVLYFICIIFVFYAYLLAGPSLAVVFLFIYCVA